MWTTAAPAGERPRAPAFALSVGAAVRPARNVTWFQASALCRASGKRLPTGEEWLRAAHGTPDDETRCYFAAASPTARDTNGGARCHSVWGAQDMIGNVWEWTDEWYAGVDDASRSTPNAANTDGWGDGYQGDGTWNITSSAAPGPRLGVPGAAARGGHYQEGPRAGVFALALDSSPTGAATSVGFRCVVPR